MERRVWPPMARVITGMNGPEMQNGQDLAKVVTKVFGKKYVVAVERSFWIYCFFLLKIGKPIKYIEVPLEKLKTVMPLGVYQIYE